MIGGGGGLINTMHQHQTLENNYATRKDLDAAVSAILAKL
jgi:hypothetical protein